jgi:hypothetical protein
MSFIPRFAPAMIRIEPHFKADDFRVPDGDSNGTARGGPSEITQDNRSRDTRVHYRAKPGNSVNLGKVEEQENSPAEYLTRVGHGTIITITAKQPALNFSGNATL